MTRPLHAALNAKPSHHPTRIRSSMTAPSETLNIRQLLPLLFIVFIDSMGVTIVVPIIPFYVLSFGAPPAVVGLVIMSYALAQFLFAPILGSLSDRFGRKPILASAQVGTFSSLLLLGFAQALPIIFLARILDGITGANLSTVQSAISDVTSNENRAQGIGLVGAAYGLGFVLGPVLGGVALRLANNDYSAPAFLAAGFAFVSIMLTTFVFRETLPPEKRQINTKRVQGLRAVWIGIRSQQLGQLYALAFVAQFIFGVFLASFALFTLNRLGFNSVNNSLFFGMFGVVLIIVPGAFVGPLTRRYGEMRLILVSFVLLAIGYSIAALTPQQAAPWYSEAAIIAELTQQGAATSQLGLIPSEANKGILALAIFIAGLLPALVGFALQLPIINAVISKRSEPSEVGQALGVAAAMVSAGTVLGPPLGAFLFDQFAPFAPFIFNAVMSLIILIVLSQTLHSPKKQAES